MTTKRTSRDTGDLRRLADRMHESLDDAYDLARACRPGIGSSFGGGSRSVGAVSDPTGETACPGKTGVRRLSETDQLYARLRAAHDRLMQAVTAMNIQLDRCTAVRVERAEANEMTAANSLAGVCEICEEAGVPHPRDHTGLGNDRLRRVNTDERDEHGWVQVRVCNGCRMDLTRARKDARDAGVDLDYSVWHADRVEHLKRERVAS